MAQPHLALQTMGPCLRSECTEAAQQEVSGQHIAVDSRWRILPATGTEGWQRCLAETLLVLLRMFSPSLNKLTH